MSYEVPSEEREQRLLRKEIAEQRELMRFTPQPLGNDTSAIGAGSHDNASGVMTTNLTLNPEIMYESVQISWTGGSGGELQVGHVVTSSVNNWKGKFSYLVSGNSTAGTGVFEPIWLSVNPYTARSEFSNTTPQTLTNETISGWTASYTNNSKDMGNLVPYSPSLIVDKMEGGNPDINVMHGAKSDGIFTTIKPKEGKTLTISTGGNIDITSNVTVLDNEIAIMQYHEDAGNKWILLSVGDSGSMIKDAVKVATTTNSVIHPTHSNVIDGITVVAGDRILVKNQTTLKDNGIYKVTTTALGQASLQRADDMLNGSVQKEGTMTYVQDGLTQNERLYAINIGGNNIVVGTDDMTWGEIGGNTWVGTATSDLDMSTYDILNVDRLKFDTTGSAVLTNTTAGINATADEMHFNVPDNDDFKFTIYDNTRFLITDTSTHVYTENGGITFERLRIDNTDAWFYGIALTPTTNTQLIGGSGSNEQWSNVYGNKLSILNNSSNVTTTTQGAVFTNATNGLTLKSPDLGGTNFGSATFTDKDGANRIEFNYDMSSLSGNAVFNYMRNGFKIRTNNSDTEALLVYPRQNNFATNDVIIDAVDSSANGAISIKLNSFERIRLDMTNTTIKAQTSSGEVRVGNKIVMNGSTSDLDMNGNDIIDGTGDLRINDDIDMLVHKIKQITALWYDATGTQSIYATTGGIGIKVPTNDTIDFFVNSTVTSKFGITETSIESNVPLNMNLNYVEFQSITAPSHTTATKRYVFQDSTDDHLKIRTDTGLIDLESGGWVGTATTDLDMNGNNIIDNTGDVKFNDDLDLLVHKIKGITSLWYDATGTQSIYSTTGGIGIKVPTGDTIDFFVNSTVTSKFGVTETSIESNVPLNMNASKITNVLNPTNPQDAMTLDYFNTNGFWLELSGNTTMTGDIDVGNNNIDNVNAVNIVRSDSTARMAIQGGTGTSTQVLFDTPTSVDIRFTEALADRFEIQNSSNTVRSHVDINMENNDLVDVQSLRLASVGLSPLNGTIWYDSSGDLKGKSANAGTFVISAGGGGAQFIQEANFQTNHTNYSMWHIVNMHMWSDTGIGSMIAATPNIVTRYMYPIYLSETKTLKNVSTYDAVAGSYRVTWGLYNNATNGELYPTTRIWTSSSNFLNFSGHSTVVGSVNQSLTAGIYWICFQFVSGTGTTIYHGNSDWHNLIGWVEDDSPSSTGGVVGWKEANPSSSMPTTMTSITNSDVSPIKGSDGLIPIIWYRW